MTRETIYRIQEPVSEAADNTCVIAPTSPLEQIREGICDVIEGIAYGICDVIYGMCDVINNLALTISGAGV